MFYDPCPLWRGHTIYARNHHKKQIVFTYYTHDFKNWTRKTEKTIEKNEKKSEKYTKKSQAHTSQSAFLP